MCSDPLRVWSESLANDLKDLHVPDLSVCDVLIENGILSEDDWEVLHRTKRSKSKIKRLIKILIKRDDPKAAFIGLAKCIELHHKHLSGLVWEALERFPTKDINSNINHTTEEHEYGYSDTRSCLQNKSLARERGVPFSDNGKNNNDISSFPTPYSNLEKVYKGQGIQCTDQSDVQFNHGRNLQKVNSYDDCETLADINDNSMGFITLSTHLDFQSAETNLHTNKEENLDSVDGGIGVTCTGSKLVDKKGGLEDTKNNKNCNTDEIKNISSLVDDGIYSPKSSEGSLSQTRALVDDDTYTRESSVASKSPQTHRLQQKRLKHLVHSPYNAKSSKSPEATKRNKNDYGISSANNNLNVVCEKTEDSKQTAIKTFTSSMGKNFIQNKTSQDLYARCNEDNNCALTLDVNDTLNTKQNAQETCTEDIESTDDEQTQLKNSNSIDSRKIVTEGGGFKVSIENTLRRFEQNSPKQNGAEGIVLRSKHPRALSQIDHCPPSVVDNVISKTHSWASSRIRSHIYDRFSSSSEDYTTTDLNYSDLNDVERDLCDNLEKSGMISEIVDQLIQEDYFSNDDWSAINEIKVKRKQATYVAKRISNKIRTEGGQNFSNMLKRQPMLRKWLSSKFEMLIDDSLSCETSLKTGQAERDTPRSSILNDSEYSDQIDGHCAVLSSNGHESRAIAKRFPCPEIMSSAENGVDQYFQKVFDQLNTAFNKGKLELSRLPSDPNIKCIVLYLKACDALYKAHDEDAERYIKLAEAAVDDTDHPAFMRSEIFTPKTWLCLRTNRLGTMERLLEENEQCLIANPNLWSNKAIGWFYFDYGRFSVRMMAVTKPSRQGRQRHLQDKFNKTAYDVFREKAKKCLRKSIDYFAHSDSSDGPIGMGFSLSLLASVELECVTEVGYLNRAVEDSSVTEAEKLLHTVSESFDEIPAVLKTDYLLSKSDLCFRKREFHCAKQHLNESADLGEKLCLKESLRESEKRKRLLNRFA